MALVDLWFLRAETLDLRYSVKRPVDLIYGMVGQRELAEDLTQETFVKAFRALDRHGPERKPSAWILRIANNTAIDYVRRKRPDSTRSPLTMTPGQLVVSARPVRLPGDTPTPGKDLREFSAALKRAVRRLRPQYRRCFVLRHIEERSYDEIARISSTPLRRTPTRKPIDTFFVPASPDWRLSPLPPCQRLSGGIQHSSLSRRAVSASAKIFQPSASLNSIIVFTPQ